MGLLDFVETAVEKTIDVGSMVYEAGKLAAPFVVPVAGAALEMMDKSNSTGKAKKADEFWSKDHMEKRQQEQKEWEKLAEEIKRRTQEVDKIRNDLMLETSKMQVSNGNRQCVVTSILEGKPLLIDGNNVVRHDDKRNWRVLRTLIDRLEKDNADYYVFFDASIAHVEDYVEIDAEGKAYLKALLKDSEHAVKCPSKEEADTFILDRADNTGSHVLSNDGYTQEQWKTRYPWVNARNHTGSRRRVHKFLVTSGFLSVPDLKVWEKIV